MTNIKPIILLVLLSVLFSCNKAEEDSEIFPPAPAELVFPLNNTECNEGIVVDSNTSTVNFQWEAAQYTTSYEFILEDLESNILHQESTEDTELEVTIARGKAFKWYVKSKSENSAEKTTSEVWVFYNAGEGITAHAPFPAELISPTPGESFSSSITIVQLEWTGSDLDNDILEYEVYFGVSNPPTNLEKVLPEESIEVTVSFGETYYWFVKTIDENNNSSNSFISNFKIN